MSTNKDRSNINDLQNSDLEDYDLKSRLDKERPSLGGRGTSRAGGGGGLLSMLPPPKNASTFGPSIKLDKLLKFNHQATTTTTDSNEDSSSAPLSSRPKDPITLLGHRVEDNESSAIRMGLDGILEVDLSKDVGEARPSSLKELTIERAWPGTTAAATIVSAKGSKEKQKNQIGYLAQLSKATELEQKERAAQSRANKAAARSKYGW